MTEPLPPLTESEVQAEKAKHGRLVLPRREDESLFPEDGCCAVCLLEPWPCPTIRLIAELERLERKLAAAETSGYERGAKDEQEAAYWAETWEAR